MRTLENATENSNGWDMEWDRKKEAKTEVMSVLLSHHECRPDYLEPWWRILFYWLLKLDESSPMLLKVSQILQLIVPGIGFIIYGWWKQIWQPWGHLVLLIFYGMAFPCLLVVPGQDWQIHPEFITHCRC